MFLYHSLRPLKVEEEVKILESLIEAELPATMHLVIQLAQHLRSATEPNLHSLASSLSTRQLLRIAKRLKVNRILIHQVHLNSKEIRIVVILFELDSISKKKKTLILICSDLKGVSQQQCSRSGRESLPVAIFATSTSGGPLESNEAVRTREKRRSIGGEFTSVSRRWRLFNNRSDQSAHLPTRKSSQSA